jgi:thymidylate synthase (FAD)
MRQLYKHVVGIEATSDSACKDHAWNEISGRYKPVVYYYYPQDWRKQSADSKQASDGLVDPETNIEISELFRLHMDHTIELYEGLLAKGVAREQARLVLPMNQYTEVIWTCSAQALLNFIWLRDEETAQVEIQDYARAMREMVKERFPTLYGIWFEAN